MMDEWRTELLALLADLTAGEWAEAPQARLAELLQGNSEAQQLYLEHMALHARLHLEYRSSQGHMPSLSLMPGASHRPQVPTNDPKGTPEQVVRRTHAQMIGRQWHRPALLAVSLLIAAALGALIAARLMTARPTGVSTENQASPLVQNESPAALEADGVAVLTAALGVQWEDHGQAAPAPVAGAAIPPRRLCLKSGLAQLEFYSGATLVLEGPADLEIVSRKRVICHSGRLRAHVSPQAKGFEAETPRARIVDLGTEFGVSVDSAGLVEVHVFVGSVQVVEPLAGAVAAQRPRELSAGRGLRIDAAGQASEIVSREDSFVSVAELQRRATENAHERLAQWRSHSTILEKDPDLAIYYSFENQQVWDRVLRNRAATPVGRAMDGAIVGCQWAGGRWPGKGALDFKRTSDRIRVRGPIQGSQMTFLAWVRLDALQQTGGIALLMTDQYEHGNPHWQISPKGELELGVAHRDPAIRPRSKYRSPVIFTSDRLGHWTQLATVCDMDQGTVTHWVDGQPAGRHDLITRLPLTIHDAEIGNWIVPREEGREPIRNLNGRIDEFALFRRALKPAEIRAMFDAGRVDGQPSTPAR